MSNQHKLHWILKPVSKTSPIPFSTKPSFAVSIRASIGLRRFATEQQPRTVELGVEDVGCAVSGERIGGNRRKIQKTEQLLSLLISSLLALETLEFGGLSCGLKCLARPVLKATVRLCGKSPTSKPQPIRQRHCTEPFTTSMSLHTLPHLYNSSLRFGLARVFRQVAVALHCK